MTSLKSLIPALAELVEQSPATLYERQRALVRAGLLQARPGRGPGSGVPATPSALATLLLSILATSSLSEAAEQTKKIATLKSVGGPCPLTGKKTLGAAMTAILESRSLIKKVASVIVDRRGSKVNVSITFGKDASEFGATREELNADHHNLRVTARLFLGLVFFELALILLGQREASA